jgi:hypothetical protein
MSEQIMRVLSRASIGELRGVAHSNSKLVWESHLDDLVSTYSLQTVEVEVTYEKGHEFKIAGARDRSHDEANAAILRQALPSLTPSQATDERIWATLALGDYKEYVLKRWAVSDATNYPVDLKIFVTNTRALVRDHSIARLWWRGYFAEQVSKSHCSNPLGLMFEYEDIPGEISGRSILTDSNVLSAYMGQLNAGLQAISEDSQNGGSDGKSYIQGIGKQLNFLAGRFQLGGVSADRLQALMQIAHRRTMQGLKQDGQ